LPHKAMLAFLNERTEMTPTFSELQSLGALRGDLVLGWRDRSRFPYVWLLTQDSKAWPLTRLLFVMKPWYALEPRQLDRRRVATVADPQAVSRAWALGLLTDGLDSRVGEPPGSNEAVFAWARSDPRGLRAAAQAIARGARQPDDPGAQRLLAILRANDHS